jgi:hypothetical protein
MLIPCARQPCPQPQGEESEAGACSWSVLFGGSDVCGIVRTTLLSRDDGLVCNGFVSVAVSSTSLG